MKKLHRFFYIAAIALVISVIAVFAAACSDKGSDNKSKQYTLTFKLSEDVDYDSYTGVAGSEVKRSKPDPTDTTSTFEGWSLTVGGNIVEVPAKMPAKNVTYYAVFAKYYSVTLNVGSGTLSGQDKLEVKANQNLYSAVKDIVPTPAGNSVFDGWYYNNVKLTENSKDVMPEKRITIEAKYTIDYTVNVYVQKEFGKTGAEDYELKTDKQINGKGFVGETLIATAFPNDLVGYTIDEEKSGTTGFTLATQKNEFDLYYGKTACDVMFLANVIFNGLLKKMRINAGYDCKYRRPLNLKPCQAQFSEIGLAERWNLRRKKMHNALSKMEDAGLVEIYNSRIGSAIAFSCVTD